MPPSQDKDTVSYDLIVLGSGIAGLAAACAAQKDGKSVLVIDKGERLGGRISARQKGRLTFNHGAQFFTARGKKFAAVLAEAKHAGNLKDWQISPTKIVQIGIPSMLNLPQFMASGIDIRQHIEITNISHLGSNIAFFSNADLIAQGRQAIITAPAAQSALLLNDIYPKLAETAQLATYDPCWTVMLNLDKSMELSNERYDSAFPLRDEAAGIGFAVPEKIRFKRGSLEQDIQTVALTIQASGAWSRKYLQEDPKFITMQLLGLWANLKGHSRPTVLSATTHRWLYAKVTDAADIDAPRQSNDGQLAIAGDWLSGPRVEQAFDSGLQAYQSLFKPR